MTTTDDVMQTSLAHFGLPKTGNRDEQLYRLMFNLGDKRKRSPAKAASKHDVAAEEDDETYVTFFQNNMRKLLDVGVSEDLAREQIGRRWTAYIALRNKNAALQDQEGKEEEDDVLVIPLKLTDDQEKQGNFMLTGSSDGNYTYKKLPTQSKPTKVANKYAAAASESTAVTVFKPPEKKKETPPKESTKANTPTPKKTPQAPAPPVDEDEEESDDDPALTQHTARQVERLLRRHTKQWMMKGLEEAKDDDFESMTKKQVAHRFMEILNGDTDDEGGK